MSVVSSAGAANNGPLPRQDPAQSPPRNLPRQRWTLAEPHPDASAALAKSARLPQVLAELLVARGITQPAQAFAFLNPEPAHLHDPFLMLGMHVAADRLERAIAAHEPVLLYGDYDVDGATAVVLLKTAIEMLGGTARFHVPHRLREGYGLQSSVLEAAYAEGVRLVITVDTGMRAFAEADTARNLGLDLIITDHHLLEAGDAVPHALAILNPNQPGCSYPEKSLCGAAIALKLAQAVLERRDPTRTREKTLPSFLKMAAIATIADAVPLCGENRTIATLGLRELRRPVGLGLRALFAAAALDPAARALTGYDVAFRLAPRINAAGRMDTAESVIELFLTADPARARELAQQLHNRNTERRQVEDAIRDACEQLPVEEPAAALVYYAEDWHRGVLGIVASRLVERLHRPVFVLGRNEEDGTAQGSGRSIPAFHLLEALESMSDLFARFGGHKYAAGVTLEPARVDEFRERFNAYAAARLSPEDFVPRVEIDAVVNLGEITEAAVEDVFALAPFGHGNQPPLFAARAVEVAAAPVVMKEKHLRIAVRQNGRSLTLKAWNFAERAAEFAPGTRLDVAFKLEEDAYSASRGYPGWAAILQDARPAERGAGSPAC